jgi:hypothetical protein
LYPLVMTNSLLLKMTIEIVDFPINSMVIFHSYVSLPEGRRFYRFSHEFLIICQVQWPDMGGGTH